MTAEEIRADEIRALFKRRDEAWARLDPVALAADYSDEAVLYSPTAGTVSGLSAIERVYRVWTSAFPDLKFETQELIIAGDRVVQTVAVSGTDTGGFLGFPPTGKPFCFPFVCLFELRGNQIVCERRIMDRGGFLLQLVGDAGLVDGMHKLYRGAIERARLEYEIKVAADIQAALLPKRRHTSAHLDFAGASIPCRAIGGDFFDYFETRDRTFGFVLADVAGKGPPAALLTAMLQGIFSAHAYSESTAADTIARVNDSLVNRGIESRFATVLYGMLSCDGCLTYCNAGHNPPLLFGRRGVRRLEEGGLIVGVFQHASFEEEKLQLEPGDTLVVFSDGVSEAMNSEGEEFGEERLVSCVEENREMPPAKMLECILETVQQFRADAVPSDDLTVFILRYMPICEN
jgi:predicted ester cyclase